MVLNIPKVIYIMGEGRSGSTILSIILGNHKKIQCVGELNKWALFQGKPKPGTEKERDHDFWEKVLNSYRLKHTCYDFNELEKISSILERYINFPRAILKLFPSWMYEIYHVHNARLFNAIQETSTKKIIVDSSKNMARAWLLLKNPYLNTKIIYLTRGPRGTLYSYLKKNIEQSSKNLISAMIHYCIKNIFCLLVRLTTPRERFLHVKYEDLMNDSIKELERIGEFMSEDVNCLVQKVQDRERLEVPIILDGNRIRKKEYIKISFDRNWKKKLPFLQRILAVIFTLPCSILLGYIWNE